MNGTAALSFSQLEALWVEAGGSSAVAPIMAAIGLAESSGGANPYGDYEGGTPTSIGIWQIHIPAHPDLAQRYNLMDPLQNAMAAVAVWRSQGLGAWSTYTNGAYLHYLDPGASAFAGGTMPTVGSQLFGGAGAAPKPVPADWSPQAKLIAVGAIVTVLFFVLMGAGNQQKDPRQLPTTEGGD